ncbi:MAG: formylglycine-generating enzyme family protein [Taibaiella sp.]|nr:formylglycine-generating enzyme family protein [Taibaiella sp.]
MKSIMCILVLACTSWSLDAPVVTITAESDGVTIAVALSWHPVGGAFSYEVYGRSVYSSSDSLLQVTADTSMIISLPTNWSWNATPNVFGCFHVRAKGVDPELILVPSGSFTMGQTSVAIPEHIVHLTSDYYLGKYEVTNAEYMDALQWAYENDLVTANPAAVEAYGQMLLNLDDLYCEIDFEDGQFVLRRAPHANGWGFEEASTYDPSNHPVKSVTWFGAASYCDWLSLASGLEPFYQGNWNQSEDHNPYLANGYRLPTEAEWEYAAKFNDGRTYPWGQAFPTCSNTNHLSENGSYHCVGWTQQVGSYPEGLSLLGFYDLSGNILEWLGDYYGPYANEAQTNPLGVSYSTSRIARGSYWASGPSGQECSARFNRYEGNSYFYMGLRICKTSF